MARDEAGDLAGGGVDGEPVDDADGGVVGDAGTGEGPLDRRGDGSWIHGCGRHDVDVDAAVGLDDAVVDDGRLVGELAGDGERVDLDGTEPQHVGSAALDAGPQVTVTVLDDEAVVDAVADEGLDVVEEVGDEDR